MTTTQEFKTKVYQLIDELKAVCANYGLGNDGNEFKVITQIFLYKFLNDKFAYESKRLDPKVTQADSWEEALSKYSDDDYEGLLAELGGDAAQIYPRHFLSTLYKQQHEENFNKILDDTLLDIAAINADIFSVQTVDKEKIRLFDPVSEYVASDRANFARALINKLVNVSFERIFEEKFDFYATLFEYLIKDYNKDGGGKYAEYYTPHAVAKIMAACLVTQERHSVTCYDPSAGSGSLLMNMAHAIGEEKCTLYTEDISQKSSHLLRLNLILNNLVHSIPNVVQGNTILRPAHRGKKFDYIVSNPPFKLDFSDYRNELDTKANQSRFFAGIPKVKPKKKDSMEIYQLFLQHIIHSLADGGKAAVVVPTGFITAQSGIDKNIRKHLVDHKMLAGVVSMPSNIFATTGTNVSILFIDASNKGKVALVDASNLGTKVKDGKNQKTLLSKEEEDRIIKTFNAKEAVDDFSVAVSYAEIAEKNYSLSAGQYFEVKIEYVDITLEEFQKRLQNKKTSLEDLFDQSLGLEQKVKQQLTALSREQV